jgi:D-alanyl-lipoteichoic acid acyltransferase DltB (MBOAT superfamily)
LLLGIRFPPNFAAPYTAVDLIDFWRRWHISLSTWLRDYLYIPLGGNRRGALRTYVNLLVTMVLGGLWHGASWTFVVWGGLHGVGLAINRLLREAFGLDHTKHPALRVLGVLFTFHFVLVTWVFFRSESFASARAFFERLATLTTYHPNLDPRVLGVMAVGLVGHFLPRAWYDAAKFRFCALPAPAQAVMLFGALLVLRRMMQADAVPFVYFQF